MGPHMGFGMTVYHTPSLLLWLSASFSKDSLLEENDWSVSVGPVIVETEENENEVSSLARSSHHLVSGLLTEPVPWWRKQFRVVVQCLFANNGSSTCWLGDFRIQRYYSLPGIMRIKWANWYKALSMLPRKRTGLRNPAVITTICIVAAKSSCVLCFSSCCTALLGLFCN